MTLPPIKKDHILLAINEIDKEGVRKGRHSSTYDLIYEGKAYPPKLVISIATRFLTSEELDPDSFDGGEGTDSFKLIRSLGFDISKKNNIKSIIRQFLDQASTDDLSFGHYPKSIDGLDLKVSFGKGNQAKIPWIGLVKDPHTIQKGIYPGFLYYKGVNHLVLAYGISETKNANSSWGIESNEITIENWFKSKFGEKPHRYGKSLVKSIYNLNEGLNYSDLEKDYNEILSVYSNIKTNSNNYWVFQANPKIWDVRKALSDNSVTTWTVKSHKDKISIGDKIILWATGSKSGCYALGEVTSDLYFGLDEKDELDYFTDDGKETYKDSIGVSKTDRVKIKITHNIFDKPILKQDLLPLKEFEKFKGGNQGTNFSSSKIEYDKILEMIENSSTKQYWVYSPGEGGDHWEEFYTNSLMAIGYDELGDLTQYKDKSEISNSFRSINNIESSAKNHVKTIFDFSKSMKIGDIVFAKNGRSELLGYGLISSNYYYDKNRKEYSSCRTVNWIEKGSWIIDHFLAMKTLTNITNYKSDLPKYEYYWQRLMNNFQKIDMKYPLNTILYGPPGTGKTYNTVLKSAEIIENRKIDSYDEALQIFKDNLHDQIEFITFHQNYSYEDFIQGLRPETDNKSSLVFDKKDGIFKTIADKAFKSLKLASISSNELSNELRFDKALESFCDKILDDEDDFQINDTAYIFEVEDDAFRYTGERWSNHSNGLRMKFSDLKEFHRNNVQSRKDVKKLTGISGLANQHATYYYLVYSEILKLLPSQVETSNAVKRKNYVIIIDEINRANISRVFGELITLIEPDKRSDGKIPMQAKLPSGDIFQVPSNLYIIGTMNTADKSIALLDIALRRRFEFQPMYPKYSEDGLDVKDENVLRSINNSIISDKGHDFQIGHSYFMDSSEDPYDLQRRMNVKVIPLLLEYFMNDTKTVCQIISKAISDTKYSIDEKSWPLKITLKND